MATKLLSLLEALGNLSRAIPRRSGEADDDVGMSIAMCRLDQKSF
jgi:hypothetical protein